MTSLGCTLLVDLGTDSATMPETNVRGMPESVCITRYATSIDACVLIPAGLHIVCCPSQLPAMAASIPTTQRAWICTGRGNPNKVLRLEQSYPVPSQLPKGAVLIKVKAAALNPVYVICNPHTTLQGLTKVSCTGVTF